MKKNSNNAFCDDDGAIMVEALSTTWLLTKGNGLESRRNNNSWRNIEFHGYWSQICMQGGQGVH